MPRRAGHRPRPFSFTSPSNATTSREGATRPWKRAAPASSFLPCSNSSADRGAARDHERVVGGERERLGAAAIEDGPTVRPSTSSVDT